MRKVVFNIIALWPNLVKTLIIICKEFWGHKLSEILYAKLSIWIRSLIFLRVTPKILA